MKACNTTIWTTALITGLLLTACGGGKADSVPVTTASDTLKTQEAGSGLVNVGGKLFSIPSPVQTALLIRKLGLPYDAKLTLATDSLARFTTKQQKAMALGIYGADLAYCTVHKDSQRALKGFKAVEVLGGDLNMRNAMDASLLERFQKNLGNEDSLLRLSGASFRAVDRYLKNDQRNDVSARVLAGGWVESLYLTLGNQGSKMDPKVAARVAEQRHSLENLIALLQQAEGPSALVDSLQGLATAFSGVTYTYTFAEPTVDAANKTTYINSASNAVLPAGAMETIIRKVRALRASIIA